jgi:hypothetical protein
MSALNRFFRGSIKAKLVKVFVLQILAISVATVLGVYAAAFVVEQVLVREALNGEAEHFWAQYEEDSSFPLPNIFVAISPAKTAANCLDGSKTLSPASRVTRPRPGANRWCMSRNAMASDWFSCSTKCRSQAWRSTSESRR